MKLLVNKKGFTLLEVIIVLAVFAILAAALFPRLSRILEDSKLSRAQTEVNNVGSAINNFNAHTTFWPAGAGTTLGGTPQNYYVTLITGTSSVDGQASTTAIDLNTMPYFTSGTFSWPNLSTVPVDYFDNHLRLNNPGNNCSSGPCNTRYFPTEGILTDSASFLNGVNQTRDPWRGPYLEVLRYDPWGRRYVSNIESAWSIDISNKLVAIVISAGPDSIVDTDGEVTTSEFNTFKIRNDDVAYILRKRMGSL